MRRARLAIIAGIVLAGGLGVLRLVGHGGHSAQLPRTTDRRCRGGCRVPLAQVLPTGPLPSLIAAGALQGSRGEAVTLTRSTAKTCSYPDGGLVSLGINAACIDANGINIEPAATNMLQQSQALGTAPWSAINVETVTNNQGTAPDGTNTATKVANGGTAFALLWQSVTVSSGATYSVQFWVKGTATSTSIDFGFFDGSIFIQAGTATVTGPGTLTGFSPYSLTGLSTTQWTHVVLANITNSTSTGSGPLFYADSQGSTTTGAADLVWGAQMQTGATATSYYPTTTAAAARSADSISTQVLLATVGDSITQGNYDAVTPWPTTLGTNLGSGFSVTNDGVGGVGTATMLSSWNGTYSLTPYKVITVMGGVNDITTGGAEATILSNLEAIYASQISKGGYVVVMTIPPCGGGTGCTTATPKAEVTALNADIAAWQAANPYRTVLVDTNLLMRDPAAPDQYLAAYDRGDHIHPNQAGIDVIAAAVTTAVGSFALHGLYALGPRPCFSADVTPIALTQNSQIIEPHNASTDRWDFILTTANKVLCQYYNGTTSPSLTSTATVTVGARNRVSCSYDGAKLKTCVNGTCNTTTASISPLATSYLVNIGNYGSGAGFPLLGGLSNIRVDSTPTGCQ